MNAIEQKLLFTIKTSRGCWCLPKTDEIIFIRVKVHPYSGLQSDGADRDRERNRRTFPKAFPYFSCASEKAGGWGREDEEDCHGFAASLIVQRDPPPPAARPRGLQYQPKLLYLVKGGESGGLRGGAPNNGNTEGRNRMAEQHDSVTQTDW